MNELVKLKDGVIVKIDYDNECEWRGCETCDYGSKYLSEFTIFFDKGYINVEVRDIHKSPLTEGFLMELLLKNNEQIKQMTRNELFEFVKSKVEKLTKNCFDYSDESIFMFSE